MDSGITRIDDGATTGPEPTFRRLDGHPMLAHARELPDLDEAGYAQAEYVFATTASSYQARDWREDGHLTVEAADEAAFATRLVVRRPAAPERFNGTLVVEWLNVSSGTDAAPDYVYLAEELLRSGFAWVGVSVQYTGVEGGLGALTVATDEAPGHHGLKQVHPERYASLDHPGDAYSYDIYSRVGQALRTAPTSPLADLDVERVLAIGESQSAYALTTYVNAIAVTQSVFDGYLIHSRGGAAAPLGEPGRGIDVNEFRNDVPVRIRSDLAVPVMIVQTETDVLGRLRFLPARQHDTATVRTWELAGCAHADKFQIGDFEPFLGCPEPVNAGQQAFVLRAALRHLDRWVRVGQAPPQAPPLSVVNGPSGPVFELDPFGNVHGGVRTPRVDVPVEVLSGIAAEEASPICALFGRTVPLPEGQLVETYGSRAAYLTQYAAAVDACIRAGFALEEDRAGLVADARPEYLPS